MGEFGFSFVLEFAFTRAFANAKRGEENLRDCRPSARQCKREPGRFQNRSYQLPGKRRTTRFNSSVIKCPVNALIGNESCSANCSTF